MASVDRCLDPFILNKSGDQVFIQTLSFFSALRLKLQQIFKVSCPCGRHLGNGTLLKESAVQKDGGKES